MGQILGLLRIIASVFTLLSGRQEIDVGRGQINLTDTQIEDLSQAIVTKHMATIAIKYLGLPHETVDNLRRDRQGDCTAFNRDVLVSVEEQESWNKPSSGESELMSELSDWS